MAKRKTESDGGRLRTDDDPTKLIIWLSLDEDETRQLADERIPVMVQWRLRDVARDVLATLDQGPAGWGKSDGTV